MQLDEKAAEVVLRSLREAIPSQSKAKVDELRSLRRERPNIGLAEPDARAAAIEVVGASLADRYEPGVGVRLGAGGWLVAARR